LDVAPELKPVFDSSLARLDDRPTVWTRAASIRARTVGGVFEVDVEADSLQDACALCIGELPSSGRPWSTCHLSIEPGPEHLAAALRDLFRIGFSVQRATISHCSQWQWLVELHGANMGIVRDVDVGLRTTSATTREVGAHLSFQMTHR